MSGNIAKTVIAIHSLFRRSRGSSVRFLVGPATGHESDIPNVGVRHLVMLSEFIQLVTLG